MSRTSLAFASVLLVLSAAACGDDGGSTPDDAGTMADTGMMMEDSGPRPVDAGPRDTGVDAGPSCTGPECAFVEIALGWAFGCGRRGNGEVLCWGANANGELGDGRMRHAGGDCTPPKEPTTQDCVATPQLVQGIDDATALATRGGLSSCAIREDGSVWCWGLTTLPPSTGSDVLVKRYEPEQIMGFGDPVSDFVDTWTHQCGIGMDGTTRCAGYNESGEIGNGDTMEVRTPAAVMMLTGATDVESGPFGDFNCAITAAGVSCWGNNDVFQLGDGRNDHGMCTTGGVTPHDCSTVATPASIPVMAGTVAGVSVGSSQACAWTSTGSVLCWGNNSSGQVGGMNEYEPTPAVVAGVSDVVEVAAGGGFTCARTMAGEVWCWGGNEQGELGDGSLDHGATCNPGMSIIDCSRTPVRVMGVSNAIDVAAGAGHACALADDGSVWCWGENARKQLGDGTRDPSATPVRVMGT
jgi:alpha-tubulin suppressor-like RCC1 family protein